VARKKKVKRKTYHQIRSESGFITNFSDTPERREMYAAVANTLGLTIWVEPDARDFKYDRLLPKNVMELHAHKDGGEIDMMVFWQNVRELQQKARGW